MWEILKLHYEDTSASVQAALEGLRKLKPVKEEDYKGLIELVDEIESAYSQLDELKGLSTLTMRDVDFISELLPTHLKVDWRRKYRDLSPGDKLQPFKFFMTFLERERSVVARLAENQQPRKRERWSGYSNHVEGGNKSQRGYYKCAFPTHRKDTIKHTTEQCKEFNKLPISGKEGKYELLKQVNACFKCFGNHKKQNCSKKVPCPSCGSISITLCCMFESQVPQDMRTKVSSPHPTAQAKRIGKPLPMPQEVKEWRCIPSTKQT